jgi:hypothetical protein
MMLEDRVRAARMATPVSATSTKGNAWLNDVQAFATGEPGPGGVTYKVYIPK